MKDKILIVDDAQLNRELLREILGQDYEICEADNGQMALDILKEQHNDISAILLDLVMPVMGGFTFMTVLQEHGLMGRIPVLVISGENSSQNENKCFDYGVADFIARPFNAMLVKKRVKNVVAQYTYKNRLEEKVEEQTADLRKAYNALEIQAKELEKRNQEIIEMLGNIVECRNLESGEHIQRVKGYTKILAERFSAEYPEYELSDEMIDIIVSASALHDIGKIAIPDSILLKPGRLTDDEFEQMKQHTVKGCELFISMNIDWNPKSKQVIYEIIRHHHERFDGRGYPDGLKGDEIPLSAQLVSVADVYDALVSERCYKKAFSKDEAYSMITEGKCGIFSPKLMDTFRMVRDEFEVFADNPARI